FLVNAEQWKAALIYERGHILYFHGLSRTMAGDWIPTPPFSHVARSAGPLEMGKLALAALEASQENVLPPTQGPESVAPLLRLAGVGSWAAFTRSAKCMRREADGGELRVIPYRNRGPEAGFEPLPEWAIKTLFGAPPAEVGYNLDVALTTRCE